MGNVLAVSDELGDVIETYECEPYGQTLIYDSTGNEVQVSAIGNPIFFKSKFFDIETALDGE